MNLLIIDRFSNQGVEGADLSLIDNEVDQVDVLDLGFEAAVALLLVTIHVVQEMSNDVTIRNEALKKLEAIKEDLRSIRDNPRTDSIHNRLQGGEAVRFNFEGIEMYFYSPSQADIDNAIAAGVSANGQAPNSSFLRRGSGAAENPNPMLYWTNPSENLNSDGTVKVPFGNSERMNNLAHYYVGANFSAGGNSTNIDDSVSGFYKIPRDLQGVWGTQSQQDFQLKLPQGEALYVTAGNSGKVYAFTGPDDLKAGERSQIQGIQGALDSNTDKTSETQRYNQTTTALLQNLTQVLSSVTEILKTIARSLNDTGKSTTNNM